MFSTLRACFSHSKVVVCESWYASHCSELVGVPLHATPCYPISSATLLAIKVWELIAQEKSEVIEMRVQGAKTLVLVVKGLDRR